MNIKFKVQEYQTEAVKSVVDCFEGQPLENIDTVYKIDPGKNNDLFVEDGIKNSSLKITHDQLLENIQKVQQAQNLPISKAIEKTPVSSINLEVEMETGTGKTYVYIKTMFELNKKYGWNKFIIVVPSIAIREGVYQTFELTKKHFLQMYEGNIFPFIYNSKSLHECESFASSSDINVMIINIQAFNARGKDARKIYEELDSFNSRRPIDVIKATNPILIVDEPQKIDGDSKKYSKSYLSLKEFNPLMILSYSATHKKIRNKVYRLDALDAYNKKLVKKIQVRGISVKGLSGSSAYIYFSDIVISSNKPPMAKLEIEIKQGSGIKRDIRNINVKDDLYTISNGLDEYKGFVVIEIDPNKNSISFENGKTISCGEATGDVNEATLRRLQIRETIKAHLEKEQRLFYKGIKVLSLFFIDEVKKYRVYTDEGEEQGDYAKYFEEEYKKAVSELGTLLTPEYAKYLKNISAQETHKGYFAQDKKSKKLIDPKVKNSGEMKGQSDDVSAYDLILKDKKRLLSLQEPTRFIFSHSALREGWDNPNVFQISALKHVDLGNETSRRQEVGRGLRISIDKNGNRMDNPLTVHDINILTVIANESFQDYVASLQKEIKESLSQRPIKANKEYFVDKYIITENDKIKIDETMATAIYRYLLKNDYIDDEDKISSIYHEARKNDTLEILPEALRPYTQQIIKLIDGVFDEKTLNDIATDEHTKKLNPRNSNFDKKEFLALWDKINKKAIYTVKYDSNELIKKCIYKLDHELRVKALTYTVIEGSQKDKIDFEDITNKDSFEVKKQETIIDDSDINSFVKYDLVGKIAKETKLTRKTIVQILTNINQSTFNQFKINPEDFISIASRLINEAKATTIIEHLTYDSINETHNIEDIFTINQDIDFQKAKKVNRHIYDYVMTDSKNEKEFVSQLDIDSKVSVYAKLPKSFFIPTPVGNYNPDWAIVFEKDKVKHIYFIAETKGDMSTLELRPVEEAKINCAKKFFKTISNEQVVYDKVDSFEELMKIVR